METVARQQTAAAGRLYRVLAEDDGDNVFVSPFSIFTALTMVAAGADGATASQLSAALALPQDADSLHEGYNKVLEMLQSPPNVTLSTANKVYVQQSYKVLDSYTGLLQKQYLSKLTSVDFADNIGASKLINGEVETETRGKIKDLIKASDLDEYVRLVLVNAIYFKGSWKQKFDASETQERDFFVTPGNPVKTPMMHMKGSKFNCGHIPELSCKALEMPYEGDRFSMIVLLPDQQDGLKELEEKLPSTCVRDIRGTLCNQKAVIRVPKFKLETSYDLIKPLQKLGIKDLVDRNADLSKISGNKELYVSKVIHKAFIEVNEEGAEAAAATAVAVRMKRCMPMMDAGPFEFTADHPFHFVIFDRETGLTLFSGRYAKPV
ncbi:leukocyte elastase inhibitor-like [Amphibalanus amphitrite]|uniref:leukocyte elastase inhibitor-like n=1 Tax=Amphibalanus amphitrite TaxID=1232801 RepID=UPI001C91349D|nr:leukocyte elastase inhibitor-like [Amphibalanus amphitrite]